MSWIFIAIIIAQIRIRQSATITFKNAHIVPLQWERKSASLLPSQKNVMAARLLIWCPILSSCICHHRTTHFPSFSVPRQTIHHAKTIENQSLLSIVTACWHNTAGKILIAHGYPRFSCRIYRVNHIFQGSRLTFWCSWTFCSTNMKLITSKRGFYRGYRNWVDFNQ